MRSKVKIKDSLSITVKLAAREIIDERECNLFGGRGIKGFLKISAPKKNRLAYTGPMAISLKEYLKNAISQNDFFLMMAQIIEVTRKLQKNNLPFYKLSRDLGSVYINSTTKELYFMYMPIVLPFEKVDELDFVSSIVYAVIPEQDDRDFLPQFNYFLRKLPVYDADRIEHYIATVDKKIIDMISSRNKEQSGFITNKPREYIEHYADKTQDSLDYEKTGLLIEEEKTGLLVEEQNVSSGGYSQPQLVADGCKEEATGLLIEDSDDMETGLLIEEEDGSMETGLLIEDVTMLGHFPRLQRVLTGQEIEISKPVFRIGKEKAYVDFFIMNNDAISRSHADIITRGRQFYVKDLNSKNRSFINNRVLPAQFEVEIFDGDVLKLANEEFIFHI